MAYENTTEAELILDYLEISVHYVSDCGTMRTTIELDTIGEDHNEIIQKYIEDKIAKEKPSIRWEDNM